MFVSFLLKVARRNFWRIGMSPCRCKCDADLFFNVVDKRVFRDVCSSIVFSTFEGGGPLLHGCVSLFEYFKDFPRVWNGLVGISYLNIYDYFVVCGFQVCD